MNVPIVRLGEIADVNWGDTSVTKSSYVEQGYTAYSATGADGLLPYADYDRQAVILSAIGARCGKVWFAEGKWSCIKNTIRYWSKDDRLDNRYLYWITNKEDFFPKRGAAQPFITIGDAREAKIPLPPLAEQRRIATILDRTDALRRKRGRFLDLLENLNQSMFMESFGDALKDPAIDKPVSLQEFADIQVGFAFKSADYTEATDGVRLCRGANILPNRMDWSDLAKWPQERTKEFSAYLLREGDIVIAMDRPWISSGFKVAQITAKDLPALLVQRVARLRPNNPDDGDFLFALILNPVFTSHFKPTETTVPHISPVEIRNFLLHVPKTDVRKTFGAFSRQVRNLAHATLAASQNVENLFSSLQQRAFGEVG